MHRLGVHLVCCTVLVLFSATRVSADEARDKRKCLEAELKAFQVKLNTTAKLKDESERKSKLKSQLKELVTWHKALDADSNLRQKSIKLIGKQASPGRKRQALQLIVLDALGASDDGRAGFQVRRWLKVCDEKKIAATLKRALEVSARVPHVCLVDPLLKIVKKSKNGTAAGAAMIALGNFKSVTSARGKIFLELCSTVKKEKPSSGSPSRGAAGAKTTPGLPSSGGNGLINPAYWSGSSGRWDALSVLLPKVLTRLTGRDLFSEDGCFELARTYKTRLNELFLPDEDEEEEEDED